MLLVHPGTCLILGAPFLQVAATNCFSGQKLNCDFALIDWGNAKGVSIEGGKVSETLLERKWVLRRFPGAS